VWEGSNKVVWLSISALFFSLLALLLSVWLYFQSLGLLSKGDLTKTLAQSSEELSKKYAISLREIETEWANMYEKFSRLAGRMDRKKALEPAAPIENQENVQRFSTRSDIIRGNKK
jgi:hypothetical protein